MTRIPCATITMKAGSTAVMGMEAHVGTRVCLEVIG